MSKQISTRQAGNAGENFVAELLKANGWQVLATQWHCRWGELDIVARDRSWLIFVEVKTRSRQNWDEGGLMAISHQKQRKIYLSASEFLKCYPQLANLACRFDVAIVRMITSDQPVLELQAYVEAGFTGENT